MNAKSDTQKSTKASSEGFTAEEKAAMKARTQELKAEARASKNKEEGEKALLASIEQMGESDRSLAARIHELVHECAPELMAKTWYGMPAYANNDGKVICFFQAAGKFGVRYATLGFQPDAALDDGHMWATSFAVVKLTPAVEAQIRDLVKKSVG